MTTPYSTVLIVYSYLNTSKSAFDGRILWIIWLDKNKENSKRWGRRWDCYGRKYSLFYHNNFTVCLTAFCTFFCPWWVVIWSTVLMHLLSRRIGRYLWHWDLDLLIPLALGPDHLCLRSTLMQLLSRKMLASASICWSVCGSGAPRPHRSGICNCFKG